VSETSLIKYAKLIRNPCKYGIFQKILLPVSQLDLQSISHYIQLFSGTIPMNFAHFPHLNLVSTFLHTVTALARLISSCLHTFNSSALSDDDSYNCHIMFVFLLFFICLSFCCLVFLKASFQEFFCLSYSLTGKAILVRGCGGL
jgi:hypothetical protein